MKLIIQIPCWNEAGTLEVALKALPRSVPGFDIVEWLIIDDGSRDETVETAKRCGVDHVVSHPRNMGLAKAFMTGLNACLALGADVIVNTDADNQYNAADIPLLTAPIVEGRAEMVVGARPIAEMEHFSPIKKFLQKFGSAVVRFVSRTEVGDAPSGFRALSRIAAAKLMVHNNYTYTLETIIQAGQAGIPVASVPIRVNEDLRPSRLVRSIPSYVRRSMFTIIRIFTLYQPFVFFSIIGAVLFAAGFLIGLRFLLFWLHGDGDGHVQSLILAGVFLSGGGATWLIAVIAELQAANRRLLEEIRFKINLNARHPVPHLWSRGRQEARHEQTA